MRPFLAALTLTLTMSLVPAPAAQAAPVRPDTMTPALYRKILDFAAAVDRAKRRAAYKRLLDFAAAVEAAKHDDGAWRRWPWAPLAQCESSGNWHSTVGQFEGGLQYTPSTWRAYGGRVFAAHAFDATPMQQVVVARRVFAGQGWGAWPNCSRRIGAR